ncbi:MAG: O-antigen ligase family protein [Coprothermobacter sp.]|nr:O-antigen ligase family protein [Coprothermobacter sp.]
MKKVDLSIIRSIGSFFILVIVVFFLFQDYFRTFLVRLQLLTEGLGTSALNRLARFSAALSAMTTFPVTIVGLGIGGFQVYYNGFDALRGDYPHNIFLEIGSELGFVSPMCLLLLVFFTHLRPLLVDCEKHTLQYPICARYSVGFVLEHGYQFINFWRH